MPTEIIDFTDQVNECQSLTALCIIEKQLIEQKRSKEVIAVVSARIEYLLSKFGQDE